MEKILTSTIPAWSQKTGENTFSSILADLEDVEIANLYVKADLPDSEVASRYFQILEGSVVKSVFKKGIPTGKEVQPCIETPESTEALSSEKKRYAYFTKNRNPLFLWGREILWKLGDWKSKELDEFLESFKPDIFMFPMESYLYFNRINKYIIKKCKPELVVGFLWDDNFTYKQNSTISYYISRFFTRRSVNKLVKQCDEVLTICPKMKEECDATFHINSTVITKPLRTIKEFCYQRNETKPLRFIYTGSLIIGRDKSLIALANAIKEINKDKQHMYLDIYTGTVLKDEIANALNIPDCCQIKGRIPQNQVFDEQENSDILVFVESFENKAARLSFSTKITDYLSSSRCVLAIGPDDISSMEYLNSEDAAICCNAPKSILPSLKNIVEHPQLITDYARKSYDCGVRNHSLSIITDKLKSILHI